MKILQIASLGLPVRPDLRYGGTERVISYLDKVYSRLGHESIVAAPGDSQVSGRLFETIPTSLWNMNKVVSVTREIRHDDRLTEEHYRKCIDFLLTEPGIEVAHDHPGAGILTRDEFATISDNLSFPILQTLHGAYVPQHEEMYSKWRNLAKRNNRISFNAISNSQKRAFELAGFDIKRVVYHGIPMDDFSFEEDKEDYLFHLGRMHSGKGVHLAIEIAKRAGRRLFLAGEVHSVDNDYWRELIEPNIDGDQIQFLGPKTDAEKIPLYQKAAGFLFPLQWEEPFGLIMIEAMACGTPVIAYSRGSVPEVVIDGKTGFVIKETGDKETDLEAMVQAVNNIGSIDPRECRRHVEDDFSIEREADNYLKLYQQLANSC